MNLLRHIHIRYFLLGVFALCFFTKHVSAQNTFDSEEELKKQAKKMFSDAEFVSAYPLYSQLLSLYPKDPNFNYRFGVCMLYATEDKEKPITYLEFASTKEGVDAEIFYYLAKAYHLNYRFDDAINTFNKFKARVSVTQVLKLQVDWQIKMCSNGKKLLRTISDLAVFEKKDLNKSEFFRSYDLPNIGGKLLVKPDEFKSDLDEKKNETSIIFLSQKNEVVYYSSFGKNEKRGKDIYMSKKLPTGEWTAGAPLSSAINTEYDEDYPFLHPNGKVLYFSSKGHNSMGGYDIFKSVLNENTGEWTEPLNLDFAINSPDDDILYITDEAEQTAYFSSSRSSTDGMISVYKIKVDRKPVDISIIKGVYAKTAGETNLSAKITVKNLDNNELVGTFDTDPITGEYLLNLPNGGKFLFTITSDGFEEQQDIVVVPTQSELKPLKQDIAYEAGTGKLIVKNIFDESADDSGYLVALKFIKERAKMEVNSSESQEVAATETKVLTPPIDSASVKVGKTKESLSNSDIVKIAFEDAREVENDSRELIQQANMALSIASQKNELSQSKYKEAELIVNNSSGLENQIQKQAEIDKSNLLKEEAGKLAKETVAAFNLAQKLEADQKDKQQEADLSMKYAAELEAAIKSNSSQDALKQLDVQKNRLESLSQQATGADNAYNNLKINAEEKEKEALIVVEKSESLKKEIVDLDLEAKNTLAQAQKADDGKTKDEITAQASALEGQKAQRQKNLDANEAKIKMLKNKAESLKQEAELVNDLVVQIKTPAETPADVTSIDKKKLAQQVYTYESMDRAKQNDVLSATKNTDSVNVIAAESSPSAVDMEVQFNKSIVDAENISDNKEREIKKVEIYKQWQSLIEEDLSVKKQKLISLSDENEKVKLTEEISKLNELSLEKEKLVRQGNTNVEKLKTQEQLVKSDGNSLMATNSDSLKVDNILVKNDSATINSGNSPNNKVNIAEKVTAKKDLPAVEGASVKPETVLSPEAISELDKTKDISKEANDYSNLALQEKKDAYNITNPQERAAAIETANNVEALAQSKHLEVTTVYANVNKAEFEKNQIGLTQLIQLSSKNDADDITVANMLSDESRFYFGKAQKSRESVNTINNFSLKQDALKKANDDELLALERQKRARDIYMKYYPNFVASATPVKSDTSGLDSTSLVKNDVISDSLKVLNSSAKVDSMGLNGNQQDTKVQNVKTATDSISGNFVGAEKKSTSDVNAQVQGSKASDIGSETKESKIANTSVSKNNAPVLSAPERLEKIKNTQQYKNYTSLKEEADGIWIQAKNEYKIADEFKNKASGDDKLSKELTSGLDSLPNDSLKKEALLKIQEYSNQARMNLSKADSVTELANNSQASANSKKTEADLFLQSLDMMEYERETAGQKKASSDISNETKVPKGAAQPITEGFEKNPVSVYSTANPIPINIDLPGGLVFKVQVGAFKNPIPQDLFQGMAPLSGETTPKGVIRYTAGIFKKFSKANAAKKEIIGFGYKDAFVVAFFDGKRIAINDAFAMVNKEEDNIEENSSANSVSQATRNGAESGVNSNLRGTTTSPVVSNELISIAKAENLNIIKGLIYTVQIGVYSRAVSTVQLFNIQPLYNEITSTGTIRYTSGAYNDVNKATEAKNSIVNIGVKDAFVTAYYNGKRISVLESTQLVFNKKENVLAEVVGMNVMPVRTVMTDNVDDKVLKDSAKIASVTLVADTSFVFKVQIGAFKEEVPIDIANKFLQITAKGINNYLDENGLTVYTAGSFKNYEAANELKNEVITAGVVDAFVVVYKDGKKISIEEAQKILNK